MRQIAVMLLVLVVAAPAAYAGPPLITDDAGTVEVGRLELELDGATGFDHDRDAGGTIDRSSTDTLLKVSTGLYRDLGLAVSLPYTASARVRQGDQLISNVDGFGDTLVELKYDVARLAGITFALKPALLAPTGRYGAGLSEGRWQFGSTLIATREFNDGAYALHANLGYWHHSYRTEEARAANRGDLWSGSLAGEARLLAGLTAVADVGLATTQDTSTSELSAYALTGLRYAVSDHLDLDAGIKVGLTKPVDDISLLYGLVIKF